MAAKTTTRPRLRNRGAASESGRRFRPPTGRPLRIGIVAKTTAPETGDTMRGLTRWLESRGARPALEADLAERAGWTGESFPLPEVAKERDFALVLGGDGTLLSVARAMGIHQIPIFGVNLGSLGFLTNAPLDQLYPGLEMILEGEGVLDGRSTFRAALFRGGEVVREDLAVNDVVITGSAIARVIEVRITSSLGFVATVHGDGVIVATPTGSTAYNLGAGGPVVHPAVDALILAPIVPLTLTQRPVVFPDNEELSLTLRGRKRQVRATFDGQESEKMELGDVLRVRKSEVRLQLLGLPDQNYFRVLRKKLLWSALPPKRARAVAPTPPDQGNESGVKVGIARSGVSS